jgi:hypothetical protein
MTGTELSPVVVDRNPKAVWRPSRAESFPEAIGFPLSDSWLSST